MGLSSLLIWRSSALFLSMLRSVFLISRCLGVCVFGSFVAASFSWGLFAFLFSLLSFPRFADRVYVDAPDPFL